MMDYQQAWDYLDRLQFFKIKLGLESMERFLGRLGDPQRRLRFIHVAGTNGKGSVASALLAVLSRAGYRVGIYTSPHLSCVRERFRINGEYIDQQEFARHATAIYEVLAGEQITYFEFTTALAMLWFAHREVDVVILEVGLGGRLDATNVITPLVGVITNVSLDHQAYLGDTLAEVAAEKAGIIKPGVPLVSGVAADETREVVQRRCLELGAPLYLLGRDFSWQLAAGRDAASLSPAGAGNDAAAMAATPESVSNHRIYPEVSGHGVPQVAASETAMRTSVREPARSPQDAVPRDRLPWSYRGAAGEISGLRCRLRGRHQRDNLSLALKVLEILAPSFPVAADDIRAGIGEVSWPGRLELMEVRRGGAESGRRVLLDGAHNPAGIDALAAALREDFTYRRLIVIWASMADKDVGAGLRLIAPLCDRLVLTRPESERSATPAAMRRLLADGEREKAVEAPDTTAALDMAWRLSTPDDLVVVAGSLYLVGAARLDLAGELVAG